MSLHKRCVLFLLGVVLSAGAASPSLVRADDPPRKKKTREAGREEPAPSIVIAPAPPPPPQRPANGSLYTDDAMGANLFSDFKATRVGDLVFVDVVEESAASVSSSAKRNRDSGTLGGAVGAIGAIPMPGAAVTAGVIGGLGSRKFEGKGETGRRSILSARITARVIETYPNGDLRVEAQKTVKINKEDEMLTLSGIVRRRDLAADNSVPTTMVGELRVTLNGKGVASADNAPGWLFRLFEKISPF
ncbi:MAG: flagellar basal body L-ring protein FlgH [Blastocatellia bacterium]|nr:flagellar basal body L-ring protein FlgH [Blastocatellia bacterium]